MALLFLSPYGSDTTGDGTIKKPYFTLEKAWDYVAAGDTIFMRGGEYEYLKTQWLTGVSGTAANPIRIYNYGNEAVHIKKHASWVHDGWYYGVLFQYIDYIYVRGIELSGFKYNQTSPCRAVMAQDVNNCIFERLSCHHNEMGMMLTGNSGSNLILNCDFYENHDPYSPLPYGNGDGLDVSSIPAAYSNTVRGCRAWYNADDGFDFWASEGIVYIDNCWAWANGYREDHTTTGGDGNGFKLGQVTATTATTRRYVYRCIGAINRVNNFSHNVVDPQVLTCELYNCFSYGAVGYAGYQFNWGAQAATNSILRNNVSYNDANAAMVDTWVTHDHNSWNAGYTVTAADFVSLDTSELFLSRRPDGSLPIINFGRLVSGSDLINTGVDVGLAYKGTYPDLGPFEYLTAYYIKSTGSDSNDGGSDATAWQTITKVNTEWAAGTFAPGDIISFRRGDTFIGTITPTESGTLASPITITSYGTGDLPVISSLSTLSGWSLYSGSVYMAALTADSQTNLVLVDNTQRGMGRYPDLGTDLSYTNASSTTIEDPGIGDATDWAGAELAINKVDWITDRCLITDHTGDVFTYSNLGTTTTPSANRAYFIQNDLRCVTSENEWYHNQSTNYLYLYGNPASKVVRAATKNYLLYNNGYDHLRIENLGFSGSIIDAVYSQSGDNVLISGCDIRYAGRSGICFYGGIGNQVYNNTVTYCNGSGVEAISGTGYIVTHNHISYIGLIPGQYKRGTTGGYQYATGGSHGVFLNTGTTSDDLVVHNHIHHISLNGIHGSSITQFTARFNYVHDCVQLLDDGGGIYFPSGAAFTRNINFNIVLDSGTNAPAGVSIARGIYADASAGNDDISYNVVANCREAGLHIHSGSNNNVTHNLAYNNGRQIIFQKITTPTTGTVFNNNKLICKSASQYALLQWGYTTTEMQAWGAFDYNYYARPIDDDYVFYYASANHTLAEWKALVTPDDVNSYGSPTSVSTENDLHFIYNNTDVTKNFSLSASMVDITNASYSGVITLQPWTGLVLIGSGTVAEVTEVAIGLASGASLVTGDLDGNGRLAGAIAGDTNTLAFLGSAGVFSGHSDGHASVYGSLGIWSEFVPGVMRYTTFWMPSELKTYSSYPAQEHITVGSNYISCRNLSISQLRIAIQGSQSELYDLANMSDTQVAGGIYSMINAWSRYKAGQVSYNVALPANCYDNPTFIYTAPGNALKGLSDFAGYYHYEDTRPTYWGAPHSSAYEVYSTTQIRGGLQRGRMCPVLGSGPEDETYWSRVKVQSWLKVNDGAYSLIGLSGYVDLSDPNGDTATLLYTMGAHGETAGNTYTLCLRPLYMDTDDTTPLAVCEGGVEIITYTIWGSSEDISETFSFTLNSIQSYDLGGGWIHMRVDYNFDLNNISDHALDCAVRLRFEDNSLAWQQDVLLGSSVHINANSYVNFTDTDVEITDTIVDDGTCSVYVQVSFNGGSTWFTLGALTTTLPCYNNI